MSLLGSVAETTLEAMNTTSPSKPSTPKDIGGTGQQGGALAHRAPTDLASFADVRLLAPKRLIRAVVSAVALVAGCQSAESPLDEATDTEDGTVGDSTESGQTGQDDSMTGGPTTGETGETGETGDGVCGNGILEAGEACDDGNVEGGDACSAECTALFEVAWTESDPELVEASAITFDDAGNLYAVGTGWDPDAIPATHLWVQQYLPDGTPGWTITPPMPNETFGRGIALHPDGDLIVVARTPGTLPELDDPETILLRVDRSDASIVAQEQMPGTTDLIDHEDALAPEPGGDFYVASEVDGADGGSDVVVSRRGPLGAEVWSQTWNSESSDDDVAKGVVFDSNGDVYVLVQTYEAGLGGGWTSSSVNKYSAAGIEQWMQPLDEFVAAAMAIDADDALVVAGGDRNGPASPDDMSLTVRKYDTDLGLLWSSTPTTPWPAGVAYAVTADAEGNIYTTGGHRDYFIEPAAYGDLWTGKLSPSGELLWSHLPEGPVGEEERGWAIAAGPGGALATAGFEGLVFARTVVINMYAQP